MVEQYRFSVDVRQVNEKKEEVTAEEKIGMDERYPFPFAIRDLNGQEKKVLAKVGIEKFRDKVKLVGSRAVFPSRIRQLGTVFYNFWPTPDDIWVIGFPRSGTTLLQEILYLLCTDLNYEKAASELMDLRFPLLHAELSRNVEDTDVVPVHVTLEESKEKRFIKCHFGFNLLHPKILEIGCKVFFIMRNPKDVLASFSRFPSLDMPGYEFEKIWSLFKYDLIAFGNYFEMLQEAWKKRNNPNLLILLYEELNTDKRAAILKIADFVDKKLTHDQLQTLSKHLHIDSFRENKSLYNDHLVDKGIYKKNEVFSFIRKGKNGGWRDVIPKELVGEIDEWIKKNFAKMPDFEIPEAWKIAMDLK